MSHATEHINVVVRTAETARSLAELIQRLDKPFEVRIRSGAPSSSRHLSKLACMVRAITRALLNRGPDGIVSDEECERVLAALKDTNIWPRYALAQRNPFSGEVWYLPKSRRDLTREELDGILDHLRGFCTERAIPCDGPNTGT